MEKRKYTVAATVTISIHTRVMAENEQEALDIATSRDLVRIQDRGNPMREWCTSGELDGVLESLEATLE